MRSTNTHSTVANENEVTQVLRWRYGQLVQGEFDPTQATVLAVRFDVDLHDALQLVRNGCPAATALRILL